MSRRRGGGFRCRAGRAIATGSLRGRGRLRDRRRGLRSGRRLGGRVRQVASCERMCQHITLDTN